MNDPHKTFLTFPNRSKLSNILRIPIKPPTSPSKKSPFISQSTNPMKNPNLKSSFSITNSSASLHKRTFTDTNTKEIPPGSARQVLKENPRIFDHKSSLPNLKFGSQTVRTQGEKGKNKGPLEKFGINLKVLMRMKNNPKFFNNKLKKTDKKQLPYTSDVNLKEIMSNVLKKTKQLIEGYVVKELKWKREKDSLLKEISLLKGIK